jgi:GT2 family glycosyltransferase
MRTRNILYYVRRFLTTWQHEGIIIAWQRGVTKSKEILKITSVQSDPKIFHNVSIIIPVYNGLKMTQACLDSLYENTSDIDFEVIIIDNASKDNTYEWLSEEKKKRHNLIIFKMDRNIGFGPAVNIGLQHSTGKYAVLLNNDTLVAPGWLDNLLSAMKVDPSIGIASPVTNYVGEGPQIDKHAQDLPPDPIAIAEYAKNISDRTEICYEPNRLVFFCVIIRHEIVDLLGYLDEGFEKGNFEDDDYCLRARMAGYRLAIVKNSFVYHKGSATFTANKISHSQYMEQNRIRFYEKVGRIASATNQFTVQRIHHQNKVSVIVRTLNRPLLLQRALASLANQTYRGFEVVVVNDGGEDVSSLVALFEAYFPITSIFHQESKGRTAAINIGLQNSKGQYVAFLDDDDILYPWHLEALLQGGEENNAKVVYGDYNRALVVDPENQFPELLVGAPSWDYKRQELLVQNYLPIHSYIVARDSVDKVGFWNENLDRLEDYEFLLRLSTAFDFYHVKKTICEYRFYLSGDSSITIGGRKKYLSALSDIYGLFPVTEPRLLHARQSVIDGLSMQIHLINELEAEIHDDQYIRREIIRLVVGI